MNSRFPRRFLPIWRKVLPVVIVLAIAASAMTNAYATDTVIRASDSGWYASYDGCGYFSEGFHDSSNKNYLIAARGELCDNEPSSYAEYRDYFVFDLSGITGPILSVVLRLQDGCSVCRWNIPPWTLSFFDVSTPISDLGSSWGSRGDIFGDLGTGSVFAVRVATNADFNTVLSIPLNANAIAAMNSAIGGKFALGGASENGGLFLGTSETSIRELVITTAATPRPVNLFWQQDGTNLASVWYMGGADGSTFLSTKLLSDSIPGWRIVAVGDLNGDGHSDLIWQQDETNVPGIWYMGGADGGTPLTTKYLSGSQPGWRIVGPK